MLCEGEDSFLHREQPLCEGGVLGSPVRAGDSCHRSSGLLFSRASSLRRTVFLNTRLLICKIPLLESSKFLLREVLVKGCMC